MATDSVFIVFLRYRKKGWPEGAQICTRGEEVILFEASFCFLQYCFANSSVDLLQQAGNSPLVKLSRRGRSAAFDERRLYLTQINDNNNFANSFILLYLYCWTVQELSVIRNDLINKILISAFARYSDISSNKRIFPFIGNSCHFRHFFSWKLFRLVFFFD